MPDVEEALRAARSLEPDDRLRLIARVWASLPPEHWAAPNGVDRQQLKRQLADYDTQLVDRVPWKLVERLADRHATHTGAKLYSAPRRFDLSTIFVVTTAYAALFAGLRGLDFPPASSLIVGVFIALVAAGQALLYGGRRPRRASMVTGVATMAAMWGIIFWWFAPRPFFGPWGAVGVLTSTVIYGLICGYIAGVLVGGVFLVADFLRRRLRRQPPAAHYEEQPAAADVAESSPV